MREKAAVPAHIVTRVAGSTARAICWRMQTFLTVLLVVMMLATLGVLAMGVTGMIRGVNDPRRSNTLMRYRVLFQMAAVLIFGLIIWMMKS